VVKKGGSPVWISFPIVKGGVLGERRITSRAQTGKRGDPPSLSYGVGDKTTEGKSAKIEGNAGCAIRTCSSPNPAAYRSRVHNWRISVTGACLTWACRVLKSEKSSKTNAANLIAPGLLVLSENKIDNVGKRGGERSRHGSAREAGWNLCEKTDISWRSVCDVPEGKRLVKGSGNIK